MLLLLGSGFSVAYAQGVSPCGTINASVGANLQVQIPFNVANCSIGGWNGIKTPPTNGTIVGNTAAGDANSYITYSNSGNGQLSDSFTAYDSSGLVMTFNITVAAPTSPLTVSPTASSSPTVGQSFSQQMSTTGGTAPYTYALVAGSLPTGISFNSAGTFGGSPIANGTYNFSVKATDSAATPNTFTKQYQMTVGAATLSVSPGAVPNGMVGVAYSQQLSTSGGIAPYTYTLDTGFAAMPQGLSLSSSGLISGTPTTAGTSSFRFIATDSTAGTAASTMPTYTITIDPAPPPPVAGAVPLNVSYNSSLNPVTLSLSGGTATSVAVSTAPAHGTTTVSGTVIKYTPTTSYNGPDSFAYTATNAGGTSSPATVSVTMTTPTVTVTPSGTSLSATGGAPYSQTFSASGGKAPYTYNQTGTLPAGLTFNAGTATLSGTPTLAGTFSITVGVTDSSTGTAAAGSRNYTLTVTAPTISVSIGATTLQRGVSATQQASASGGSPPYTYTVTGGALPTGLNLTAATGAITGTPAVAGAYSFTLTATDVNGFTGVQGFVGNVGAGAPIAAASSSTVAYNSGASSYTIAASLSGGTATSLTVTTGTTHGSVAVFSTSSFSYTPAVGYAGTDSFTYTATNAVGTSSPATVSITVSPPTLGISPSVLTQPQVGISFSQQLSTAGGISPYNYVVTTGTVPTGLSLSAAGLLSGTPTVAGSYAFTVQSTDSASFTTTASYTGTIGAGKPVTANSSATVGYSSSGNTITPAITGGTPTSLSITTAAAHGTAAPSGISAFTYTPTAGYSGSDTFSYTATNAIGTSNTATITVTIGAPTVVITPSAAWTATQGSSYTQTLTWSGGAAPYSAISVTGLPAGLSYATSTTGATISGTPTSAGSFSVTASATDSSTPTPITKPQTFTLTIGQSVPVAVADSFSTTANQALTVAVTANDTGAIATIAVVSAPAHGAATVNGLNVVYTPAANYVGSDSFTYTASGPGGTSAPATVTITVASPGAPTAAAQTATVNAGQAITLHVGATAANGPVTSVAIVSAPASGSAVVSGTDIVYTAAAAASGSVQFSYTMSNLFGTSAPITVSVTVAARTNAANDVQVKGVVAAHGQTASRFATAQLGNFSRRLESLHGTGWAQSSFGLGFAQPVAPVKPLLAQWSADEADRVVGAPLQAGMRKVGWPLLSQASKTDATSSALNSKDLAALPELPAKTNEAKQELSLWIAGTVDFGQRNANGQQEGFRFTTNGVSMGADYRLSDQLTIGVGTGYSRDRSDIGDSGSKSIGQSVVAAVYGSVRPTPDIFIDGMLGYGALSFDSKRYVTDDGSFASGQRGGNQVFVALSAGYEFRGDGWMWSPYGKLDLAATTLAQYSEAAAGNNALTYFKQQVRTSSGTFGLRTEGQYLSRAGMWTPRARLEYRRQFSGAGEAGISYTDLASSGPAYVIRSDDSFTGNWTAGLGMRLLMSSGISLMVDYSSNLNVGQGRYSSILLGINVPLR